MAELALDQPKIGTLGGCGTLRWDIDGNIIEIYPGTVMEKSILQLLLLFCSNQFLPGVKLYVSQWSTFMLNGQTICFAG